MRIIDDKGRLFGKVNIIDFLVILFLLFLIPVFYFGHRLLKRPSVAADVKKAIPQQEKK